MILFGILLCMLIAILIVALMTGAGFILVFGDAIICVLLIVLLIRALIKKKDKEK